MDMINYFQNAKIPFGDLLGFIITAIAVSICIYFNIIVTLVYFVIAIYCILLGIYERVKDRKL